MITKHNISGIILLNKPLLLSSNVALQKVKRLFKAAKAGHTGSLDPLATGMLPICLGEATKFSQYDLESDKTYIATGHLGIKTATGDAAGEVLATRTVPIFTSDDIQNTLNEFHGETLQVPSMFSALKYQGRPLYDYARKGITIDRAARCISIKTLELLQFTRDKFEIRVTCSKGTYIRNLVEDIGEKLGCGAHVSALHRLSTASYSNQSMYTLEELEAMDLQSLYQCVLSIDMPVQHFPFINLTDRQHTDLRQGKVIVMPEQGVPGQVVRLYDGAKGFLGLGLWDSTHIVRAKRLLSFTCE